MITITAVDPPAAAAHVAVLAELHAACFPTPWSVGEIAKLLGMPGAFAGIAACDGDPCGFHLSRSAGGEAEIISIGAQPQTRRCGVGGALLQNVFDRARRSGAWAVFVEVAADNTAAASLYRGAGFAQVGRRAGYYASDAGAQDALVLRADMPSAAK
jgi:[ribosomal protein S18]-alanine N-acetyltransferase